MQHAPDPLAFTPVPSAIDRHDGWTAQRQREFITQLARIGVISAAAKAVGKSRQAAHNLRKRAVAVQGAESSFVRAWDAALAQGGQAALDTAIDRCLNGVAIPYFYRGTYRGKKLHYDNRLLLSALRVVNRKAER